MKKILFVCAPNSAAVDCSMGGAVASLLNALIEENERNRDFDFYFVSPYGVKKTYTNTQVFKIDVNIKRTIFGKRINLFQYYNDCFNKAKEINPDYIIYENGSKPYYSHLFAKEFGREKMMWHIHWQVTRKMDISKTFSTLISCSTFIENDWKEWGRFKQSINFFTLKNCLCIQNAGKKLSLSEKEEFRKSLGFEKDDKIFIYTGRLQPQKGVAEILQALKLVEDPKVKVLVVGGSNYTKSTTTGYVKKLYKISKNEIANKRVIFTGYVSPDILYKYYEIADAQLIPSLWQEAAGLIALEGRAHNLPQIITNSGGLPEFASPNAIKIDRKKDVVKNLAKAMQKCANTTRTSKENIPYTPITYYQDFKAIINEKK